MKKNSGFTLLEIIFVVSIIAVVYFVAIPQFNLVTGTESAEKLGRLASDIRSAYDMAVLHNKPYRLVFQFAEGRYWLEVADRREIYLSDEKIGRELTADEIKEQLEIFEEQFEVYEEIVGKLDIKDPETDKPIAPTSPVLMAKSKLRPVEWQRVANLEWQERSIGPYLIFKQVYCEHHGEPQSLELLGVESSAILYFFPQGYVEQCGIQVGFTQADGTLDPDQEGYTITTSPFLGVAEVVSGYEEVEIKEQDAL